jgi:hypothetical protein
MLIQAWAAQRDFGFYEPFSWMRLYGQTRTVRGKWIAWRSASHRGIQLPQPGQPIRSDIGLLLLLD